MQIKDTDERYHEENRSVDKEIDIWPDGDQVGVFISGGSGDWLRNK